MDWQEAWAITHVTAALAALVAGLVVLGTRKGTGAHRAVGAIYAFALVLVNAAALSLHRESTFGVFHGLAVISLATLVVGLAPLLLGTRSAAALTTHAYCMVWSYAGLVAAGSGQLAVAVGGSGPAWRVPLVIATVLGVSGVAIFTTVPSALRDVLGGRALASPDRTLDRNRPWV